jgi:hypothetical protein
MCIEYTSLKACLKDPFPLPYIDQVVDLTARCKLLSFLDAYLGYHQIPLAKVDQPTTTFITPFGCFCYVKMQFGLKNAGATYQQCMQSCFDGQTGHNLEVYVDDIVVKTRQSSSLIADLEEKFTNLRRFNNRLNIEKCTFGVPRIKLLGYTITKRGIEVNPNKISDITEIDQVRDVKDIQHLKGCLVALSHFVSRLGERGLPLYKLLKKFNSFHWMDKTQRALDDLQTLISKPSVLASPEPGEILLLFVTAPPRSSALHW